ncbi:MAG: hypothetical protein U5K31_03360 [Balneolaceae bacterium]|nr:hypothetical protein [Balneolaceae bacterium]
MKKVIRDKFRKMERRLSEEYGPFNFFGVFLPEESPNRWDLLVSANWLASDDGAATRFLIERMREHLDQGEIIFMSTVVVLEGDHPDMDEIYEEIEVEHGFVEMRDEVIFGRDIERAYILTCRRSTAEAW